MQTYLPLLVCTPSSSKPTFGLPSTKTSLAKGAGSRPWFTVCTRAGLAVMAALLPYHTHCQQKKNVQSDREETLHGQRRRDTKSHVLCQVFCTTVQLPWKCTNSASKQLNRLCHRVMCDTHIVSVKSISHPDIWNGECHCCARGSWCSQLIAGPLHLLLLSCPVVLTSPPNTFWHTHESICSHKSCTERADVH